MTVRGLAAVGSPKPMAQGIEHLFLCIAKVIMSQMCFSNYVIDHVTAGEARKECADPKANSWAKI